jgi:hypothetical protein
MDPEMPSIHENDAPRRYFVERPAARHLSPIDTSFSFHSNTTTATGSTTTSTAHTWSSAGQRPPQNLRSSLTAKQIENKALPAHGLPENVHRHYLHSIIPSPPLLSAGSSILMASLQQSIFAIIDTYLHRGSTDSIKSSLRYQVVYLREQREATLDSPKERRKQPLSHTRKVAAAVCTALMMAAITLTAFYASKIRTKQPKIAQHVIMGGSTAIVALAALLMLSVDRSMREILAMAAVAFTICQCVQSDLSNTF